MQPQDTTQPTDSKRCTRCGETKELGEYPLTTRGRADSWCRACKIQYLRDYRAANRDMIRAKAHATYIANRDMAIANAAKYRQGKRQILSAKARAYYAANRDRGREGGRTYYANNREQALSKIHAYQKSNPDKTRAKAIINNEVKRGRMPRAGDCSCAICETDREHDPSVVMEYHHPDYDKPLQVIALCRSCHRLLHGEIRREAGIS